MLVVSVTIVPKTTNDDKPLYVLLFPPYAIRNFVCRSRVGYRMDDADRVEAEAEKQLTRRYWRFLGGISDAISRVGAAKVEAATLAVGFVVVVAVIVVVVAAVVVDMDSAGVVVAVVVVVAVAVALDHRYRCHYCLWLCFCFSFLMTLVTMQTNNTMATWCPSTPNPARTIPCCWRNGLLRIEIGV